MWILINMNKLNRKNLISILILGTLVLAIPLTIYLVRQQQVLKGKALGTPPIEFIGPANSLITLSGGRIGLKVSEGAQASVDLRLTSPFGAPPSGVIQPTQTPTPTTPGGTQPTPTTPAGGTQPTATPPTAPTLAPTTVPSPTRIPTPTPSPAVSNTCNIEGVSEGQVISGSYSLTITANKSTQYWLAIWQMDSSRTSPIFLGSTQGNDMGLGGSKPPANGYFECRIQTTSVGGTTIYSKRVNFTVSN